MRGDINSMAMSLPQDSTVDAQITNNMLSAAPTAVTATQDAMSWNTSVGSLTWALVILVLYAVWGYWDEKRSLEKSFSVGEIKANLSNFVKITLVVVIGINLMNVFLTKVASLKIPFVSKLAGAYIPLFSV